jgi:diacylglycerol kinase (ATP)
MRTLVIANPNASQSSAGEKLAQMASDAGWTWHWTDSAVEASSLARDAVARGFERVVAAGGDGTVHHVIQGLMAARERAVFGVLPLGTGNDVARTLGFSIDPEVAIAELYEARGGTRNVDVSSARVGAHRRFLAHSSAGGVSGDVDRIVSSEEKERWGPLAYIRGALDLKDIKEYDLQVRVDGQLVDQVRCVGVVAANGRTVGGGLRVAPAADPEDGLLDLLVVEAASRPALAALGAQLKTGGVLSNSLAHYHLGARIALTMDPAMPINVDGELLGDVRHAHFVVIPGAITACIGPAYRREPELAGAQLVAP